MKSWVRQSGFTMVELLVALVLSMILIGSVASGYIVQKDSYEVESDILDMQTNVRLAMDQAVSVIRNAGLGCTENFAGGGSLTGIHRTVSAVLTAGNLSTGPDVLTVVSGLRPRTFVSGVDPGSGNPILAQLRTPDGRAIFDTGYNRYIFFAPYDYSEFLQVFSINDLSHQIALSSARAISAEDRAFRINAFTLTLDLNAGTAIDVDGDGNTSDESEDAVPDFYIFDNTRDLKRDADATDLLERSSSARVAAGIEDLQFEYGWDDNDNGVIDPAEYFNGDDPKFDSELVRVVRISILGRTPKPDPAYQDPNGPYTIADHTLNLETNDANGIDSPFDHHFHRQLLVETVMVRNLNL